MEQNELSLTIKQLRKEYGLTQEDSNRELVYASCVRWSKEKQH